MWWTHRSISSQMFFKISVLKKKVCNFFKKDSNIGVFLGNLWNFDIFFTEHVFWLLLDPQVMEMRSTAQTFIGNRQAMPAEAFRHIQFFNSCNPWESLARIQNPAWHSYYKSCALISLSGVGVVFGYFRLT